MPSYDRPSSTAATMSSNMCDTFTILFKTRDGGNRKDWLVRIEFKFLYGHEDGYFGLVCDRVCGCYGVMSHASATDTGSDSYVLELHSTLKRSHIACWGGPCAP